MYVVRYQVWVRPSWVEIMRCTWQRHVTLFKELGVEDGWIDADQEGRCLLYLRFQRRKHWLSFQRFCQPISSVQEQVGAGLIGWQEVEVVEVVKGVDADW